MQLTSKKRKYYFQPPVFVKRNRDWASYRHSTLTTNAPDPAQLATFYFIYLFSELYLLVALSVPRFVVFYAARAMGWSMRTLAKGSRRSENRVLTAS